MGCNCRGQQAGAPVTYVVVAGGNESVYRSVSEARAAAARTGGKLYKDQGGARRPL